MQGKRHGHGSHMNFQGEKLVQRYTGLKSMMKFFFVFFSDSEKRGSEWPSGKGELLKTFCDYLYLE